MLLFRTLSTCRWQERSKQIPCRRLAILEDICKINGLFTLLPLLWSIKETWHPDPSKMVDPLVCHLLSQLTYWEVSLNKVVFFVLTFQLSLSLVCWAVSRASLDLVTLRGTKMFVSLERRNISMIHIWKMPCGLGTAVNTGSETDFIHASLYCNFAGTAFLTNSFWQPCIQ